MDIRELDLSKTGLTDEYIVNELVHKDIHNGGTHFFYVKIDKRNLDNFKDKSEFIEFYQKMYGMIALRYANKIFSEEYMKNTSMKYQLFDLNHEIEDKEENTTWMCFEFKFVLIYKENNVLLDFQQGVQYMKTDYCPIVKVTEELKEKYTELSSMKDGEIIRMDGKIAKEMIETGETLENK